jgi:hypothetical protein
VSESGEPSTEPGQLQRPDPNGCGGAATRNEMAFCADLWRAPSATGDATAVSLCERHVVRARLGPDGAAPGAHGCCGMVNSLACSAETCCGRLTAPIRPRRTGCDARHERERGEAEADVEQREPDRPPETRAALLRSLQRVAALVAVLDAQPSEDERAAVLLICHDRPGSRNR